MECVRYAFREVVRAPLPVLAAGLGATLVGMVALAFFALYLAAPIPRPPLPSEKAYTFVTEEGATRKHQPLPCWQDRYMAAKEAARAAGNSADSVEVEPAEVFVSLVVPAYNEEERLGIMLTEAAAYLEQHYGPRAAASNGTPLKSGSKKSKSGKTNGAANGNASGALADNAISPSSYEILIVSDGSTDRTVETALTFARKHLAPESRPNLRVVSLEKNRGKGGAVTHGLRHVRGAYALFADADGATRFSDLGPVLDACRTLELLPGAAAAAGSIPAPGRLPAVSVGSRAHMVNTPAVVKRSALRNFLMRSFHVFLKLMTPPKTAKIGDTQCGFKLFSRGSLPHIVPWMHSEGWIFDVEMLMLAESANIKVAEVPVGWKEIKGSKLNVVWDSLGMAWGLAVLRGAWMLGVYRRI